MNIPPYLTRLGVPQEVGPVRIGLHFAEDKELSQTELDDARRYLREGCVGPRGLKGGGMGAERTSSRSA